MNRAQNHDFPVTRRQFGDDPTQLVALLRTLERTERDRDCAIGSWSPVDVEPDEAAVAPQRDFASSFAPPRTDKSICANISACSGAAPRRNTVNVSCVTSSPIAGEPLIMRANRYTTA